MGRAGIDQLLYLMDQAFELQPLLRAHSVLSNLKDVRDEEWRLFPPGGGRSIAFITEHVAECKFLYANQAFAAELWTGTTSIPDISRSFQVGPR